MHKKNRSRLSKFNTLLIKFNIDSDSQIISFFNDFNLEYFKVSNLIQRWAVEVPFWKEEEYVDKFYSYLMVDSVMQMPQYKRQQEIVEDE